jgi:hypothetical protein
MNNLLKRIVSLSALTSVPVVLFTLTVPGKPAAAQGFGSCVRNLVGSGIAEDQAGTACADALVPRDLSACVQRVTNNTSLKAENALQACYRVRRPRALASCVVKISSNADNAESDVLALDNCRRSLLPDRYSECVVALNANLTDISAPKAMETCISAEAFPRNLFPERSSN